MSSEEFNTGQPLGYFVTWTTYGTWLPGDKRGWKKKDESIVQLPNQLRRETSVNAMREKEFILLERDRMIVEDTVRRHCEIRNWDLFGINARSNHVHVVLNAHRDTPESVRNQLKAWCTRSLQPYYPGRKQFWTEGASCRWINRESDLDAVIEYTVESQDRKGLEYE